MLRGLVAVKGKVARFVEHLQSGSALRAGLRIPYTTMFRRFVDTSRDESGRTPLPVLLLRLPQESASTGSTKI